jgi:hypothetical protein
MNVVQSWTSRGRAPFAITWWAVHVVVIVVAVLMLNWRNKVPLSIRARLRARRARRTAAAA